MQKSQLLKTIATYREAVLNAYELKSEGRIAKSQEILSEAENLVKDLNDMLKYFKKAANALTEHVATSSYMEGIAERAGERNEYKERAEMYKDYLNTLINDL